ncbi:uncharacterized protein [Phyllobates terribilis]|uniref:uncharacterized protein n=1 Tax=Phyllobates terribilis TaxID=111132 RepID=UPI003CCB230D
MHECPGKDGSSHGGSSVCPVPYPVSSTSPSLSLGQESVISRSTHQVASSSKTVANLVVPPFFLQTREIIPSASLAGGHDRCQSHRLGGSFSTTHGPGPVESPRSLPPHQHSGDKGDLPGVASLAEDPGRVPSPCTIGQCHGRGIHKPSGRNAQQARPKRGGKSATLGREDGPGNLSSPHSRGRQLDGRLSQSAGPRLRRMVSPSRGVSPNLLTVGHAGRRPHGVPVKPQGSVLCSSVPRSASNRPGRASHIMVTVPTALSLSTSTFDPSSHQKGQDRGGTNSPSSPRLAQTCLVRRSGKSACRLPLETTRPSGPPLSGSYSSSEFSFFEFNGMVVEATVLKAAGFTDHVIQTLINARKPATSYIYHRTWRASFRHCEQDQLTPMSFSLPVILAFLQSGLEVGLSLSTLKGQVSALSILFQRNLASRPQVLCILHIVLYSDI